VTDERAEQAVVDSAAATSFSLFDPIFAGASVRRWKRKTLKEYILQRFAEI
jgi:hypothetical protein